MKSKIVVSACLLGLSGLVQASDSYINKFQVARGDVIVGDYDRTVVALEASTGNEAAKSGQVSGIDQGRSKDEIGQKGSVDDQFSALFGENTESKERKVERDLSSRLSGMSVSLSLDQVSSVTTIPARVGSSEMKLGGRAAGVSIELLYTISVSKHFGLGFGLSSNLTKNQAALINGVEIKKKAGEVRAFVQPELRLTEGTALIGRIGVADSKFTNSISGSESNSTGVLLGLGIRTDLSDHIDSFVMIEAVEYKFGSVRMREMAGKTGLQYHF